MSSRSVFVLILLLGLSVPWLAVAQDAAGGVASVADIHALTEAERADLLGRLTDTEVRDLVRRFMAEGAAAEASIDPATATFTQVLGAVREEVAGWVAAVPRLPGLVTTVFGSLLPEGKPGSRVLLVLLLLALILGAGWLAQRAVGHFVQRVSAPAGSDGSFLHRLGGALLRLFLRLVEVGAFVVGAGLVFMALWQGHEPNRLLASYLIVAIALVQVAARLSDALWSPGDASARLVPVSDADAPRVHRYFLLTVASAVVLVYFVRYLRGIGVDVDVVRLVNFVLAAVYVVLVNIWMWRIHRPIAALLDSGKARGMLLSLFAATWPVVYGALTVIIWVSAVVSVSIPGYAMQGAGFATLLLAVLLPFAMGAVRPIVDDLFSRGEGGEAITMGESVTTRSGMRTPLTRILRVALLVGSLVWAASWWGIDLVAVFSSGPGGRIGQSGLQILAALVVAWLLWNVAKRTIDPHLVEDQGDGSEADEVGGTGVSRVATLLPLLRKVIYVVLVTMTAMVVLSAMGVNIGPLLAGAGVIGIAVGFGAQSLVTDIISGIFFLMDDAFRRGEYIETGGITGSVEKISLRSCQLRHHNGPLHTVPYGQMSAITNFSRDWAIMKFEIRVPFEVNVDRVRKLIKKTGQQMMEDPEVADMLLEPLKSQGVNRMDDSAFIVRCKFTAKPGKQFVARRIAYTKIQEAFQREGIHFAPRRVIVETTGPGSPDAASAGAAVAAQDAGSNKGAGDDRG